MFYMYLRNTYAPSQAKTVAHSNYSYTVGCGECSNARKVFISDTNFRILRKCHEHRKEILKPVLFLDSIF